MPRKYDKVIRFYSSWFADWFDPDKAFSDHEIVQLVLAVRDCQVEGSIEPLEKLPLEIRRALSMATMGEQCIRLIETSNSAKTRGQTGGEKSAELRRNPELAAASRMRKQLEDAAINEREQRYEQQKANKMSRKEYLVLLDKAAKGDKSAADDLQISIELAKELNK